MMQRSPTLAAAVALALALSACGEATAPRPVAVTLTVIDLHGPLDGVNDTGEPVVTCSFTLRADAAGGGTATWLGATFRIYAGSDRSTPVDEAVLSAEEVRQVWGADQIAAGESQLSS
jgi:hypothetical protein